MQGTRARAATRVCFSSRSSVNKKTKCGVLGCYNSSTIHEVNGISYFKIPMDKIRAKQWLKAIRRKPQSKMVVCEVHFESHQVIMVKKRKRLAADAVPTLHLPDASLVEQRRSVQWRMGRVLVQHRATQAPPESDSEPELQPASAPDVDIFIKEETLVSSPPLPPTCIVPGPSSLLDHPPVKEEPSDDDVETLFRLSQTYLNPELAKCIEIQLLIKNERKAITESNKSDEKLLLHALKLHFAFPRTYKVMRQTLGLPSIAEMRRLFQPLTWEINKRWACGLTERFAGTTSAQRECAVCVKRAPVRLALAYDAQRDRLVGLNELDGTQRPRVARYAVVMFARGVHANWCQPLTCCLVGAGTSSVELWHWIDAVISKLFGVGLKVRALVTDFDDYFINPSRPLLPQTPYITLKERQIYRFYDCTQMMIGFRDCLMKYNMTFGDKTASWDDVIKLYEHDLKQKVKLAPGLTATHVRPERARKGRPTLALALLSPAVAGALAIAAERGVLPATALGTAQIINSVSALYESLHEKELNPKNELKVLKDMIVLFSTVKLVDKQSSQPESDTGVLAALCGCARATLALAERARVAGHASLPMCAFNNDPLHGFFDCLSKGLVKPTSKQVYDAFRKSFVFNVVQSVKRSTMEDYGSFLLQAGFVRGVSAEAGEAEAAPPARLVPRAHWQPLLDVVPGTRAPPLLARRLLEQCLVVHAGCEAAREYCAGAKLPVDLLRLLEWMERQFMAHLGAENHRGALRPLLERTAELPFDAPCACFPVLYLKTLYLRYRFQNLIQYNNNRLKNKAATDFTINVL